MPETTPAEMRSFNGPLRFDRSPRQGRHATTQLRRNQRVVEAQQGVVAGICREPRNEESPAALTHSLQVADLGPVDKPRQFCGR
jgi:hypothetical protein